MSYIAPAPISRPVLEAFYAIRIEFKNGFPPPPTK
jgi:hypothetical protein